jgi:limonene-1,2-epoxide hydrolase
MKKEQATRLINIYGEAWQKQDPELILTVFTQDASYNDPKEPENFGHESIRKYWISKVQGEQKDIHFKLLNVWVDAEIVIAEWNVKFIDIPRNLQIDMTEVGIFTVRDNLFSSLREYYKSTKTPL